jgi:hypothetical protein
LVAPLDYLLKPILSFSERNIMSFEVYLAPDAKEDDLPILKITGDPDESIAEFFTSPETQHETVLLEPKLQILEEVLSPNEADTAFGELVKELQRPRTVADVIEMVGKGIVSKSREALYNTMILLS